MPKYRHFLGACINLTGQKTLHMRLKRLCTYYLSEKMVMLALPRDYYSRLGDTVVVACIEWHHWDGMC